MSNKFNNCKKGEIYRKSYSRKTKTNNVKVPGSCIRATSQTGKKTSIENRRFLRNKAKSHEKAKKLSRSKSKTCSKNQIKRSAYMRSGYTRKGYTKKDGSKIKRSIVKGTIVSEGCTKNRGGLGRSGPLFHLEEDVLKKFGYEKVKQMTELQRHRSLKRALKGGIKPLPLFRRINALYVLNKNQDPALAKLFRKDRDYVKTTNEYKNRDTARPKGKTKSKSKSKMRKK